MRLLLTMAALGLAGLGVTHLATTRPRDGLPTDASVPLPARYDSQNVDVPPNGPVHGRSRGTVGLVRRGSERVFASGTLIAPDLVLTTRHATHVHSAVDERRPPSAFDVLLATDAGPALRHPVLAYAHTSALYDLCVLRIGPDPAGRLPGPDRVQALSPSRVPLDAPLYVIHHPQGQGLRVAEGGHVLFPFEATEAEIDRIAARLRIEGDADGAARRELRASYRRGPRLHRLNYSRRWAHQPILGADCATFDGSSGAPVYDAESHAWIGMLFAGGDPTRLGRKTSWANHEAVLPAPVILRELAQAELLPR